jgi:hypothetical protein
MKSRMYRAMVAAAVVWGGCMGDPCDDAWEPDFRRGLVCADTPARCAQLQTQPDRTVGFAVALATTDAAGKPVGASALKHRAACVRDFMGERGVSAVTISPDNTALSAVSTFRRIAPALEFKVVGSFTANCQGPGACAWCGASPVQVCKADAFCEALSGQPVNSAAQCLQAAAEVGCMPAGMSCDGALTWATDGNGACHLLPTTCLPTGWVAATTPCLGMPQACM